MQDGGATLNTPIFTDGKNPQIVINLGYVKYATGFTFSPTDPSHEDLSFQGMDNVVSFLTGRGGGNAINLLGVGEVGERECDEGRSGEVGGSGVGVGAGVADAAREIVGDVAHFFYYDILSWASFTGFGFELLIAMGAGAAMLYALGVYDDMVL